MPVSIRLIAMDDEFFALAGGGLGKIEAYYCVSLTQSIQLLPGVIEQSRAHLEEFPREPKWGAFLTVDRTRQEAVGTCAFKFAPNSDGEIEIAYFTFPPFENRGIASEMARELVDRARSSPDIRKVIAHTLPEKNASTRVLTKIGMTYCGERIDPEDGKVWRWEMFLPQSATLRP